MFGLGKKKSPKIIKDTRIKHGIRFSYNDVNWVVDPRRPIFVFGSRSGRMSTKIMDALTAAGRRLTVYSAGDDVEAPSVAAMRRGADEINEGMARLMIESAQAGSGDGGFIVVDDVAAVSDLVKRPSPSRRDLAEAAKASLDLDGDLRSMLEGSSDDADAVTMALIASSYDEGALDLGSLVRYYPEDVVLTVLMLSSRSVGESAAMYAARMAEVGPARRALTVLIDSGAGHSCVRPGEEGLMSAVLGGKAIFELPFLVTVLRSCMNTGYGILMVMGSYTGHVLPFLPISGTRIMAGDPGDHGWLLGTRADSSVAGADIDVDGEVVVSSMVYDGFMKTTHMVWPSPAMGINGLSVDVM